MPGYTFRFLLITYWTKQILASQLTWSGTIGTDSVTKSVPVSRIRAFNVSLSLSVSLYCFVTICLGLKYRDKYASFTRDTLPDRAFSRSTVVLTFTWFQVTESSSLSVYELSVECSSNTTTYLGVTLRDIIQNKALISSNSLCQDGNSVKKLSAPTLVKKNESLFNVELTGLFILFILFTKRA